MKKIIGSLRSKKLREVWLLKNGLLGRFQRSGYVSVVWFLKKLNDFRYFDFLKWEKLYGFRLQEFFKDYKDLYFLKIEFDKSKYCFFRAFVKNYIKKCNDFCQFEILGFALNQTYNYFI